MTSTDTRCDPAPSPIRSGSEWRAMRRAGGTLWIIAASVLAVVGCGDTSTQREPGVKEVETTAAVRTFEVRPVADVVAQVQDDSVLLVDVREQHEWEAGRAPTAIHVPLGEVASRLNAIRSASRGREVVFICRSGTRSAQAAQIAIDGGLPKVTSADGGMEQWVREDGPLTPSNGRIV